MVRETVIYGIRGTEIDILSLDFVDGKSMPPFYGRLIPNFGTVGHDPPHTPVPDGLDGAKSMASDRKNHSLPVNGMYPLLDLITEQGSSGLGNPCSLNQSCSRSWCSSRQNCHCSTISPRIYQRALTGCLLVHYQSQFQNAGQHCSQAVRNLWLERGDCEISTCDRGCRRQHVCFAFGYWSAGLTPPV